jgi:hypothetical protein
VSGVNSVIRPDSNGLCRYGLERFHSSNVPFKLAQEHV